MDIFRFHAEYQFQRYTFLFTYHPKIDEVILRLEEIVGSTLHIYDVFPHINHEEIILDNILSVITESGQEMFIPSGLTVNFFDQNLILFGIEN